MCLHSIRLIEANWRIDVGWIHFCPHPGFVCLLPAGRLLKPSPHNLWKNARGCVEKGDHEVVDEDRTLRQEKCPGRKKPWLRQPPLIRPTGTFSPAEKAFGSARLSGIFSRPLINTTGRVEGSSISLKSPLLENHLEFWLPRCGWRSNLSAPRCA